MSALVQRLLNIHPREVNFERRGFTRCSAEIQDRLENIGLVFLRGYHAALREPDQDVLAKSLDQVDLKDRGFAYEGAGMALALLDGIHLRSNSFHRFVAGRGKQHIFMLHVGAGWAYARLPWLRRRMEQAIGKLQPVLRWLVLDGFGFHEGYFHFNAQIQSSHSASRLSPLSIDARHVFYQGLGRSLWFVNGTNAREISSNISRVPLLYHGDAWSGVGLACAYAGGLEQNAIAELRELAGKHAAALAQGAAFAAKARQLAGNPQQHTGLACAVLCEMSAEEAARLCDDTFCLIDMHHSCPYQHWRELLQTALLLAAKPFFPQPISAKHFSSETLSRGKSNEIIEFPPLAATKLH